MGRDIHTFAERKNSDGQWAQIPALTPFSRRNYDVFAWLVHIAANRGIPKDACAEAREAYANMADAHSPSWVSLAELLAFDYDERFQSGMYWNTYRKFVGERYFEDLEALRSAGAERVVFFFDN